MKQSKFLRAGGVAPLAIAVALVAGCKGKTTVKDNPETLSRLDNCNTNLADKKTAMERLEAELAQLKVAGASANEFVLTIQGDALEIKARPTGGGGGTSNVSDAVALDLSQKFIDLVRKSRGNIQKCYEQALKKNASLQARTISLRVTARYGSDGAVTKSTFSPDSLGSAFDTCMQAVAKNWKLPATASGMSFQNTVTLSPS